MTQTLTSDESATSEKKATKIYKNMEGGKGGGATSESSSRWAYSSIPIYF